MRIKETKLEKLHNISISKAELQSPYFKAIYKEYDTEIKARNLSIKGKGMYQLCVKEFLLWLELQGIRKIKKIDSGDMIDYYEYITTRPNKRKTGTLSQSMVNQHLFSLRMLVDYLLKTGQIKSGVLLPKNNTGTKKERDALTQNEVMQLYKNCKDKREKAILSVGYGCGLRRAEMEELKTNDINFVSGVLVVRAGKFGKRRDIVMSDRIIKDLKDYYHNERPHYLKEQKMLELSFFVNNKGKQMEGDHMNEILKEIIERTGNTELMQKEITLHSLRHSIAMHFTENGADIEFIQTFLGHSFIDTTAIYAKKNKERQKLIKRQHEARNYRTLPVQEAY